MSAIQQVLAALTGGSTAAGVRSLFAFWLGGGGAAPAGGTLSLIGTPTTSGNNTTIALPTGAAAGDRAYLSAYGGATPSSISGMTSVHNGTDQLSVLWRVFARTIDAGDVSAGTLTIPSGSVSWVCWLERGSLSNAEESLSGVSNYSTGTTTSAVAASTSTVDGSWHIAVFGDDQNNNNTVATPPSGYTQIALFANATGAANTTAIYRKTISPAGATGTPVLVWGTGGANGMAYGFISKS